MPDQPKISFQLTARDSQRLEVRVTAPGGETRGETALPETALLDELAANQGGGKLPGALVEKAGKALYSALVSESVDELVIDSLNDAVRDSAPLLFELRFDPDQIALTQFPWEMIQNAQGQFLVRDGLVDLTRYITYPQPPPVFDATIRGLPLFRVISTPSQLPPLTSGELAIKPIDTLDHATFDAFMRRVLIDRLKLWGLHFDGHGALAQQCANCDALNGPADAECWSCRKPLIGAKKIGALAFEKGGGEAAWIPAAEFGAVLYNAQARLALLLACETAKVGSKIVFSGLAPGLLLAGVPAVIGMQYPILDTFAGRFANEFYAALLKDNDILAALRVARRMNLLDAWYSPALYLRRQPTQQEVAKQAVYLTRNIDTAAPARVNAGATFLTRLWIRRPETKPLSAAKLRAELDIPKSVPVKQAKGEAEVKFEPVENRRLRRGEVDVKLVSKAWDVTPDTIKLFIDETLDAPPAIFTVKAKTAGKEPLIFSAIQDGGVIHTVTHIVEAVDTDKIATAFEDDSPSVKELSEHSAAVDVGGEAVRMGGGLPLLGHIDKGSPSFAPAEETDLRETARQRILSEIGPLDTRDLEAIRQRVESVMNPILAEMNLIFTRSDRQALRDEIVAAILGEPPKMEDKKSAAPPVPRMAAPEPPPPPQPAPAAAPPLDDFLSLGDTEQELAAKPDDTPPGEFTPPEGLPSVSLDETQVPGKRASDTRVPAAAPTLPPAPPPPGEGGRLPDTEAPTRAGGLTRDEMEEVERQRQAFQQGQPSAPPPHPLAAPSALPSVQLGRKSGPPILPILLVGALGLAAVAIGLVVVISGLLGGGPTPEPTQPVTEPASAAPPADTVAPDAPQPISPYGEKIECVGQPVQFLWLAAYDDSGIAGYDVEIEQDVNGRWTLFASDYVTETTTTQTLNCDQPVTAYRWRVRASDTAGNAGEFSPDAPFVLYTPVTEAPVVLTPPLFRSLDIVNLSQAKEQGGYDFGTLCVDETISEVVLEAFVYDPDGYDDVIVEVHYALFDPDRSQVGQEFTVFMNNIGDGYYSASLDTRRAAKSVKFGALSGTLKFYLVAIDNTGVAAYYPSPDPLDRVEVPLFMMCVPG